MSAIGKTGGYAEHGLFSDKRSAEHGFTLIEALVVVAVASLVAGLLFPRVEQSLALWRFRASLAAVQTALEDARALALRTGAPARFATDASRTGFSSSSGSSTELSPSVRFGEPATHVDFYSDGSSTGGNLLLTGAGGRRATIHVSPDTGLIGLMQ